MRRRAKAINFGIIYGISAFGLANQLGIPRDEAGAYIKKYFERFPGIRDYMDATKAQCARTNGYVTTIFGRKCHYPQIASQNPSERAFIERAAINAPHPGLGRRHHPPRHGAHGARRSAKAGLCARMLLQVHDELVFEVPDEEVEATLPVVTARDGSRRRSPAVQLAVPLQVDARAAAQLGRGALRGAALSTGVGLTAKVSILAKVPWPCDDGDGSQGDEVPGRDVTDAAKPRLNRRGCKTPCPASTKGAPCHPPSRSARTRQPSARWPRASPPSSIAPHARGVGRVTSTFPST